MKKILPILLMALSVPSLAQTTYKANRFTSVLLGGFVTLDSQTATGGNGGNVTHKGGDCTFAGCTGGNAVIAPGSGLGSKGIVAMGGLLRFTDAPDSLNGHIRNDSNTPIFIVDQSTSSGFIGAFAGNFTHSGTGNFGFGQGALSTLTTGTNNTAMGLGAMQSWSDGSENVAIGQGALGTNSSVNNVVAVGSEAMNSASNSASENVAIGRQAGRSLDSPDNVMIGHRTGFDGDPLTTGSQNTFIGALAGLASPTQRTGMTVLGYNAKGDCDNCVVLGRTNDYVQSPNGTLRLGPDSGYVEIGIDAPVSYNVDLPNAAPVAGQVLAASTPTQLTWQTPGVETPAALVTLTADNQAVDLTGVAIQPLDSDDPVAANRTFTLSNVSNGVTVKLVWIGTGAGELIDDSAIGGGGNVRLSGNWFPLQYGTLTLNCNNASGALDCYELSRSAN